MLLPSRCCQLLLLLLHIYDIQIKGKSPWWGSEHTERMALFQIVAHFMLDASARLRFSARPAWRHIFRHPHPTREILADDGKVEYFAELLLTASPFDAILVCRTTRFRATIPRMAHNPDSSRLACLVCFCPVRRPQCSLTLTGDEEADCCTDSYHILTSGPV